MREDKGAMKSSGKENQQVVENGKKKTKEERPATKVVVRRLPPTMTEEQFKMQVSPLPEVDYFYFVPADMTLTPNAFSRAYINFIDQTDLFLFTQKFDGYVFIDSKGGEFPAVVEFAPFQRIPKNRPNRKKDPKVGTIESDATYIQFKEYLEAASLENRTSANVSKQHFFETSLENEKKEINNTPLLDYIKNKRAERQRIRDEKREEKRKRDLERKKAKEEQRRTKKEDDTSVLKPMPCSPDHPPSSSSQPPTKTPNNEPTLKELDFQTPDIMIKVKDSHPPRSQSVNLNCVHSALAVTKQVRDMVQFFDKIITENSSKENSNVSVVNCEKHKDIETDIIKSTHESKKRNSVNVSNSRVISSKYMQANNSYGPSKPQLDGSNNVVHNNVCRKQIPSVGTRSKVFVPRANKSSGKLTSENSQRNESKTTKIEEVKNGNIETEFPVEIFKKKFKKVVADVLGHSTVKNPNESVISKPTMFVKRVLVGSGEQCTRPGFNTPHYYLPPRTFGCGPPQYNRTELDTDSKVASSDLPKLTRKSQSSLPKVTRYSKSDRYVDDIEGPAKVGGFQESVKIKSGSLFSEKRPQYIKWPQGIPKKS